MAKKNEISDREIIVRRMIIDAPQELVFDL
jgi:hypothetical protein